MLQLSRCGYQHAIQSYCIVSQLSLLLEVDNQAPTVKPTGDSSHPYPAPH